MLEVDEQLRKEGVPIPARELRSLALVCQATGLEELRVYPDHATPAKGSFAPNDLPAHIFAWFRSRYGDRLKMDFSPGSRLIKLGGNLWLMRLPFVRGRARFMINKDLAKRLTHL